MDYRFDPVKIDTLADGKATSTNISNTSNDDMVENKTQIAEIESVLDEYAH